MPTFASADGDKAIWEGLLEKLVTEADYEWRMIDASRIKVHPPRGWCTGRKSSDGSDKRGLNTKIHLAVDAHGMRVRISYYSKCHGGLYASRPSHSGHSS